jgi:RNA polymerase sigma factor (sigma-70 family)
METMATASMTSVIQHLRRTALRQEGADLADGELLECYITRQDEAAFEALVRRHGPMVLGVCRRILRNDADADDAFQATFLVLVRKAASVRPSGMLSNWLYGVAHNTALKAKAMNHKRRSKEKVAGSMPKLEASEGVWREVQALLDEEMGRLPDKYRVPIVLCDLEGKTIKEAARHLIWPQGTLATRLAQGRRMLAQRLAKHGLTLSGGALAALLSHGIASANVPAQLVNSTIKAATFFAAGQMAGAIASNVSVLTEGVLKTMLLTRLKLTTGVLLVVAVLGAGAAGLTYRAQAAEYTEPPRKVQPKSNEPAKAAKDDPETAKLKQEIKQLQEQLQRMIYLRNLELAQRAWAEKPDGAGAKEQPEAKQSVEMWQHLQSQRWNLGDVDLKKNAVSVRLMGLDSRQPTVIFSPDGKLVSTNRGSAFVLEAVPLAKDAKIIIDGKEGKLQDLKDELAEVPLDGSKGNLTLSLEFTERKPTIASIQATTPKLIGWPVLVRTDMVKNTITLALLGKDVTLPVRNDAKVYLYTKEAEFKDLKPGMSVELRLGADGERVAVTEVRVILAKK